MQFCACRDRKSNGRNEDFISTYNIGWRRQNEELHQAERQPECNAACERRSACNGLRARAACVRGRRLASHRRLAFFVPVPMSGPTAEPIPAAFSFLSLGRWGPHWQTPRHRHHPPLSSPCMASAATHGRQGSVRKRGATGGPRRGWLSCPSSLAPLPGAVTFA